MKEETIATIKNVISQLNAFDWDVETCRRLCLTEKRDDIPPATDESYFFEEDLLSRLRIIEKGLDGISEALGDTMSTLRSVIPGE